MRRLIILGLTLVPFQRAAALEFPEISCVTPPATVTKIAGINTRHATKEGRYTLPDLQESCQEGYVDQGGSQPPNHCVAAHIDLLSAAPLHASADCVAGSLVLEGQSFRMPVSADCASGGIHASKAFKTLCPSYGGKIEE